MRRGRGRRARAPRPQTQTPGTPDIVPGIGALDVLYAAPFAAQAHAAELAANQYIAAKFSGSQYAWQQNMGAFGMLAGGPVASLFAGAFSTAITNRWQYNQGVIGAAQAVGVGPRALNAWSGIYAGTSGIADPTRPGQSLAPQDYLTVAAAAGAAGGPGALAPGQIKLLSDAMAGRWGAQAGVRAVAGMAPFLSDPLMSQNWASAATRGADIGDPEMMAGFATYGGAATQAALRGIGNPAALRRYRRNYAEFAANENEIATSGAALAGAQAGLMGSLAGGGTREETLAGYEEVEQGAIRAMGDEATRIGMLSGNSPRARAARAASQARWRAQNATRRGAAFAQATVGPSEGWINATTELQTAEQAGMMDPFMPMVNPGTRLGLIGQYSGRLGEIYRDTAGNPVARAAQAGTIQQLQLAMVSEQNALRMGVFGQLLDISAGAPTGFQALGLSGMSARAYQAAVPGGPLGLGGSGAGTVSETNRLLTEIATYLRGAFGATGGGSVSGNVFSLAPDRANHKVN